jgi:hypothetical protein
VQPDWDWCHECGYDPEGLKPPDAELAVATAVVASQARTTKKPRSERRAEAKRERDERKHPVAVPDESLARAVPVDPRPAPPRTPTETVYGLLPYDDPSSVSPVEPDPPDFTERNTRRFTIIALGVIVVGLILLVVSILLGG